ncbi:peptide maturation system protein (TIGR04066 family) [Clostridium saccharoperbutylacetonicum]|uniref:Peptide maturation system protein, TIGR04066 family n=1 Tax=Clostridium saccharoperbutylacetonicum N1-4(HMT) TaxID=931276 RepID=M1MH08_9CLOT|nr:TIGR04066 family peptide maturation system protein [Clostridium saccharoperbutylacetonicum]AGF55623.1 peptide maturation system protein, TIGR04066 family [Clostridium saccharoperbutylacetonicum N1-4(HMT)]NRT63654.1 peptide maturation system protein (TIGR04066 family) [Clostridium saccharoperbutylacetonicum]NSB27017.1 peptide maturation system protein (TIGR04066 family) [Clostridium saccharoperbutylacetonicum]NSB40501.1 peptide maturation system protein (TIGR04066 family) [Clostridium sacchar
MESLMIYPFDIESMPLVRHEKLLSKYSIKVLVSPNGWGMTNKDAGIIDNSNETNITISENFEKEITNVDTVLFVESNIKLDFETVIYPKVLLAIEQNKNIICSIKLEEKIKNEIMHKCMEKHIRFEYLMSNEKNDMQSKDEQKALFEINSPVVFVCGNDERTDKFEIQLLLREYLLKDGYIFSQIGTKNYSNLLDFHVFPQFMYENSLSETDKIIRFNHYVKYIELTENPDLIVIGVPFGIMPFDNEFNNNFGIMLYEISNALKPDYVIISNTYREYLKEDFKDMCNLVKYKFGFDIDCFNISNTRIDWNSSKQASRKAYTKIPSTFIDEKISQFKENDIPVVNILNEDNSLFLYEHLINSLSENEKITWL